MHGPEPRPPGTQRDLRAWPSPGLQTRWGGTPWALPAGLSPLDSFPQAQGCRLLLLGLPRSFLDPPNKLGVPFRPPSPCTELCHSPDPTCHSVWGLGRAWDPEQGWGVWGLGSGRAPSHGCCLPGPRPSNLLEGPSPGTWGPRPRCRRLSSGALPWRRKQEAGTTLWARQDLR